MKKEIIEVLEEKFSKDKIKKRPGSFGKTLDYIEAHEVLKRANRAFAGDWGFVLLTTPKDMVIDGNIVAHVRVSYTNPETGITINRDGIGGKKITYVRQSPEDAAKGLPKQALDLTNDMKAGTSDAIKKAFSTFGIALDLYGTDDDDDDKKISGNTVEATEVTTDGPAKPNQISAIKAMVTGKKLKLEEVLVKYKVKTAEELKESQAKDVIVNLNKVG